VGDVISAGSTPASGTKVITMTKVKPFLLNYKSYDGSTRQVTFQCQTCKSDKCYRAKRDYHLTFFEGSFRCLNCKKEVNYSDDDFTSKEVNTQYKLFN
jgi:hypothetical protein